jgi:hypothetical protein
MAQSNPLGTILILGAVGVGAYWIYETYFAAPAAASSGGSSPTPPPTTSGSSQSAPTNTTSTQSTQSSSSGSGSSGSGTQTGSGSSSSASSNAPGIATLGTLLRAVVQAAYNGGNGDPAITYNGDYIATPDVFNYYLTQLAPTVPSGLSTPYGWPPNAAQLFANQSTATSLTAYWNTVSPTLSQSGMSGLRMGKSRRGLACLGDSMRILPYPRAFVTPRNPNQGGYYLR